VCKAKVHKFHKTRGKTNKAYVRRVNNLGTNYEHNSPARVQAVPAHYRGQGLAESDGNGIANHRIQESHNEITKRKREKLAKLLEEGKLPVLGLGKYWPEKLCELIQNGTVTVKDLHREE
jgi:hypothetical protein